MESQPDILYARSFHESVNKLTDGERRLCNRAIEKFRNDPRHSGLNFEYLGKQSAHNHHSIRASRELRIILGVEPNMHDLQKVVLASAGHHDWAYDWSRNRGHCTDISDGAPLGWATASVAGGASIAGSGKFAGTLKRRGMRACAKPASPLLRTF